MKRFLVIVLVLLVVLLCFASCDIEYGMMDAIKFVKQNYNVEEVFSICHIDENDVKYKERSANTESFKNPYYVIGICDGQEKYVIVERYNHHPSVEVDWIFEVSFQSIIDKLNAVRQNAITEHEGDYWQPYYTYITSDKELMKTHFVNDIYSYDLDENASYMLIINNYAFIQTKGQIVCFSLADQSVITL